jgi:cytoskeleton protein RodZ
MFEIGASLREARTRRGLTAEDVQKAIRIRDRYLTALEQEDWALLPGDAYTKGFLRAYAEFLGLDGNLYVDEFNSRYARREEQPFMPAPLSPIGARSVGLLRPLIAIGLVVAVVAGVAAWQLSRGSGTPGRSSPPTTSAPPPTRPATSTSTSTSKPSTSTAKKHAAQPPARSSHAVLTATRGRVWLLVRSGGPTGKILFEGTLEQGKTLPLAVVPRVWIRVGAPSALDVRLGGRLVTGLPAHVGNVYLSSSGLTPAG